MEYGFLSPLRVEFAAPWSDGYTNLNAAFLLEPLTYKTKSGDIFTVPKDFCCDGASVPWFFRRLVPRWNRTLHAGFLHDFLIRHEIVTDREADGLFYEALRISKINIVTASLMWLAVRVGSSCRAVERRFGRCSWFARCPDGDDE